MSKQYGALDSYSYVILQPDLYASLYIQLFYQSWLRVKEWLRHEAYFSSSASYQEHNATLKRKHVEVGRNRTVER